MWNSWKLWLQFDSLSKTEIVMLCSYNCWIGIKLFFCPSTIQWSCLGPGPYLFWLSHQPEFSGQLNPQEKWSFSPIASNASCAIGHSGCEIRRKKILLLLSYTKDLGVCVKSVTTDLVLPKYSTNCWYSGNATAHVVGGQSASCQRWFIWNFW